MDSRVPSMSHYPLPSWMQSQAAGSELDHLELKLVRIWDASVAGGSLNCCATILTL